MKPSKSQAKKLLNSSVRLMLSEGEGLDVLPPLAELLELSQGTSFTCMPCIILCNETLSNRRALMKAETPVIGGRRERRVSESLRQAPCLLQSAVWRPRRLAGRVSHFYLALASCAPSR